MKLLSNAGSLSAVNIRPVALTDGRGSRGRARACVVSMMMMVWFYVTHSPFLRG